MSHLEITNTGVWGDPAHESLVVKAPARDCLPYTTGQTLAGILTTEEPEIRNAAVGCWRRIRYLARRAARTRLQSAPETPPTKPLTTGRKLNRLTSDGQQLETSPARSATHVVCSRIDFSYRCCGPVKTGQARAINTRLFVPKTLPVSCVAESFPSN